MSGCDAATAWFLVGIALRHLHDMQKQGPFVIILFSRHQEYNSAVKTVQFGTYVITFSVLLYSLMSVADLQFNNVVRVSLVNGRHEL